MLPGAGAPARDNYTYAGFSSPPLHTIRNVSDTRQFRTSAAHTLQHAPLLDICAFAAPHPLGQRTTNDAALGGPRVTSFRRSCVASRLSSALAAAPYLITTPLLVGLLVSNERTLLHLFPSIPEATMAPDGFHFPRPPPPFLLPRGQNHRRFRMRSVVARAHRSEFPPIAVRRSVHHGRSTRPRSVFRL